MATYRKIKDLSALEPKEKKTKKVIWTVAALVLLAVVIFSAYWATHPWIFNEKKAITIEIVHSDGFEETFKVTSRKETFLEVLKDEKLVIAEEVPDGIFITAAGDPEVGQERLSSGQWVVCVGKEPAQRDVSGIVLRNGQTYKIIIDSN